jgi:hypothetical protein
VNEIFNTRSKTIERKIMALPSKMPFGRKIGVWIPTYRDTNNFG